MMRLPCRASFAQRDDVLGFCSIPKRRTRPYATSTVRRCLVFVKPTDARRRPTVTPARPSTKIWRHTETSASDRLGAPPTARGRGPALLSAPLFLTPARDAAESPI